MIVYVTLFDKGYLDRAIALAHSFAHHCVGDVLLLGCMDTVSAELLVRMDLPGTRVLAPGSFISGKLLALRAERNMAEFCWTTKPFLLAYALDAYPDAQWAVYLDADSLIFGLISPVLHKRGELDCVLTPHNFDQAFADFEMAVGRYNAGFVAFRNSGSGRSALADWRDLCSGAVSAVPSSNAYGDQKYLEQLVKRWRIEPGIVHKGLNVAPWNVGRYRFTQRGAQVLVDDEELLYYHFQGFLPVGRRLALLYKGVYPLPKAVRKLVYRPYLSALGHARRLIMQQSAAHLLNNPGLWNSLRALWVARTNIALNLGG